jgi:hypothetical protein
MSDRFSVLVRTDQWNGCSTRSMRDHPLGFRGLGRVRLRHLAIRGGITRRLRGRDREQLFARSRLAGRSTTRKPVTAAGHQPVPQRRNPGDRWHEVDTADNGQGAMGCHERTGDGTESTLHTATVDPPDRTGEVVLAQAQLRGALHRQLLPRNRDRRTGTSPVSGNPRCRGRIETASTVVDQRRGRHRHPPTQ